MSNTVLAISKQALSRMPQYLHELKVLKQDGVSCISAGKMAKILGLNEVQVRKDFAVVSTTGGKPKTGFDLNCLIADIQDFLGYNKTNEAVLVGVGSLGRALLSYKGFSEYGINIVTGFDVDKTLIGSEISGIKILDISSIARVVTSLNIKLGVICTPASQAQKICDEMIQSGILAIWNFAPIHLNTSADILVRSENMAASLAHLSNHLKEKL